MITAKNANAPEKLTKILGFACYLLDRSGSTAIVVITNDDQVALRSVKHNNQILVSSPNNHEAFSANSILAEKLVKYGAINAEFLADKILVAASYLEDIEKKREDIQRFRSVQELAVFSIVACKRTTWWSPKRFARTFNQDSTLIGGDEELSLLVAGKAAEIQYYVGETQKCLAIVPEFNESDVIGHVVKHLLEQGLDVHVIDNWSTDGSYEIALRLAAKHPERVFVERFPSAPSGLYEWGKILDRVADIAYEKRNAYKWAMLNDADELRYSPWDGISLQQALSFINFLGYNSVDFTLFNYSPVKEGYKGSKPLSKFFRYGEFPHEGWAFLQIKAWVTNARADLSTSGGHHAKIPNQRIYPLKFLLDHYPIRSSEQAIRKIFKDRKPRFIKEELEKGWSRHYDKIEQNSRFIKNPASLIDTQDNFSKKYLIERLSGIGLTESRS